MSGTATHEHAHAQARQTRKTTAIAIACCLLALTIIGVRYAPERQANTSASVDLEQDAPDGIATQATLTQFNQQGQLARRVLGEEIRFFERSNETVVFQPVITLPDQKNPDAPWKITAAQALLKKTLNQVDFTGRVQIENETARHGKLQINTEQLTVDLDRQYAETDKAVTIRTPSSRAQAVGMKADFARERLLLTANVKETHEPRR